MHIVLYIVLCIIIGGSGDSGPRGVAGDPGPAGSKGDQGMSS